MNIKGVFGEYARILVSLYTKQGFLPPSFSLRLYSSVMLYQFHSFYRYNKPIMIIIILYSFGLKYKSSAMKFQTVLHCFTLRR